MSNDNETKPPAAYPSPAACPVCENDSTLRYLIGHTVECDKCGLLLSKKNWFAITGKIQELRERVNYMGMNDSERDRL